MSSADPWAHLRRFTPARIALGRTGSALPTREVLALALAHARARDAVHVPLDAERLAAAVAGAGYEPLAVESAAPDRATYLARPDLGRQLSAASRTRLQNQPGRDGPDLLLVVADGLSSPAVTSHAPPLLEALRPHLTRLGLTVGPVAIAIQARVALGDEIASAFGARAVLVLIGERPGLSAPDSLGAYLTYGPRPGLTDAERNCVSNIRAGGLAYDLAAGKLAWLIEQALRRRLTGVTLKDESDLALLTVDAPAALRAPNENGPGIAGAARRDGDGRA